VLAQPLCDLRRVRPHGRRAPGAARSRNRRHITRARAIHGRTPPQIRYRNRIPERSVTSAALAKSSSGESLTEPIILEAVPLLSGFRKSSVVPRRPTWSYIGRIVTPARRSLKVQTTGCLPSGFLGGANRASGSPGIWHGPLLRDRSDGTDAEPGMPEAGAGRVHFFVCWSIAVRIPMATSGHTARAISSSRCASSGVHENVTATGSRAISSPAK